MKVDEKFNFVKAYMVGYEEDGLTLKEIDVQHTNSSVRGYDHMMLYQNVQNRAECNYPMLDEKGLAEYLLQCLIHLFYACDTIHPLLSGTSSADNFYFSMGASSAFFDMAVEDDVDCFNIVSNIVNKFKEKGDKEKTENKDIRILDDNVIKAEQFIKKATETRECLRIRYKKDRTAGAVRSLVQSMVRVKVMAPFCICASSRTRSPRI